MPPVPGKDLRGCVRLPHHRRRRRPAGLRREPAPTTRPPGARRGRRRRPARPRGGRRAARPSSVDDHGRRVRPAADAAAGRRGRRRGPAPADRARSASASAPAPPPSKIAGRLGRVSPDGRSPTGPTLDVDVVVFAAGVRPRDELARDAGLEVGERGGVVVDDGLPRPADPSVWAIGEVACIEGRCLGPRRPRLHDGRDRRRPAARRRRRPSPAPTCRPSSSCSGVDVASFGDAFADDARRPRGRLSPTRSPASTRSSCMSDDARDPARRHPRRRRQRVRRAAPDGRPRARRRPRGIPAARRAAAPAPAGDLPDDAAVCSCNNVSAGRDPRRGHRATAAPTSPAVKALHQGRHQLRLVPAAGQEARHAPSWTKPASTVSNALCEHFDALPRAAVRRRAGAAGSRRSARSSTATARGRGCDICKPVVALDPRLARHRPRPRGRDARRCRTPTTTSWPTCRRTAPTRSSRASPAARSPPRGSSPSARSPRTSGSTRRSPAASASTCSAPASSSCPQIWKRLVDAGFESGHAYGKSLRTVKSCVGSTWCRYGVQDSVGLAIALELRYRGLRSPHKIKLGVSGCARECAEARGKDVGVIATENGWNLYVGGNGGFTPRHAQLLAEDLDTETLVRAIDRFLMYYVRTADRLQRTAPWVEDLEGGIDAIRAVVFEDSPRHLRRPRRRDGRARRRATRTSGRRRSTTPRSCAGSRSFVNAPDQPDPSLAYVAERGQPRPRPPSRARRRRACSSPARPWRCADDASTRTPSATVDCAGQWVRGVPPRADLIARARRRGPRRRRAGRAVPARTTDSVHAVEKLDPYSGANVMSRGIVGSRGRACRPSRRRCTSRSSTCAPARASTRRARTRVACGPCRCGGAGDVCRCASRSAERCRDDDDARPSRSPAGRSWSPAAATARPGMRGALAGRGRGPGRGAPSSPRTSPPSWSGHGRLARPPGPRATSTVRGWSTPRPASRGSNAQCRTMGDRRAGSGAPAPTGGPRVGARSRPTARRRAGRRGRRAVDADPAGPRPCATSWPAPCTAPRSTCAGGPRARRVPRARVRPGRCSSAAGPGMPT